MKCWISTDNLFGLWCLSTLHVAAMNAALGRCISCRSHALSALIPCDIKEWIRQVGHWSASASASFGHILWDSGRYLSHCLIRAHRHTRNFAAFQLLINECTSFESSGESWGCLIHVHGLVKDAGAAVLSLWCLQDGLHILNLVPHLQIVLSIDRVLCASTIKLFGMIWQRSHARFMLCFWGLRLQDLIRLPLEAWPMTWTLIEDVISLLHLLWLVKPHISSPINFTIRSIDFKTSY